MTDKEFRLSITAYEEDMQVIDDEITVPNDFGFLFQKIIDTHLDYVNLKYREIIEYLLDAMDGTAKEECIKILKSEFQYEV